MTIQFPQIPSTPARFGHFIAGDWSAAGADRIDRNSPAHGVLVSSVASGTAEDVDLAVAAARRRFDGGGWADKPASYRAEILRKAADMIRDRIDRLALHETLETGKPYLQSRGEIESSAQLWYYAAGQAQALHGESFNNFGSGSLGIVLREPVGVVGLITPWNFPFLILSERLPFILASGCTCVVKPSEHTSTTTLIMAEILAEAGLPAGVVNVVTGYGMPVGQAIVEHRDIDMVSFTGSTRVGRSALMASAGNIKKVALELGGKNPVIVLPDADLDKAADGIVYGILFNAGQCCVSPSRLIAHKSISEDLAERVLALMQTVVVGDPLDPATQVGPIVTDGQLSRICGLVAEARGQGGSILTGGDAVRPSAGHFMTPTLIAGVDQGMNIVREEVFGPVLAMSTFDTVDEAVAIANDTEYGLSGTVWSSGLHQSLDIVRRIRAGRIWVNTTITGGPEMPIGGYKQSGLGRETGLSGVSEYTEVKSVIVDLGDRQPWVRG